MDTVKKLVDALTAAGAPDAMLQRAREGMYHDYKSPLAAPITTLVNDARRFKLESIANRAIAGEFDATREEGEAWMRSQEGQDTLNSLTGRKP